MSGRPLRVGIDGRAFSSPAGGVRRYVSELYAAIARIDPDVRVVAIGGSADAAPPGIEWTSAIPLPTNLGWMAASIPLAARRARLDVYHAPAYTAPLWGVHPLVLTIHDVSYERRPEWNAYRNDRVRRLFYRRSALVADRILTDSEFSRAEIVAAYGVPGSRIDVVPLAASRFFTPGAADPRALPAQVRQPYVLHVGDLHIRRNISTALTAVLAVRRDDQRVSLVCAGIDRGIGEALARQARDAGDPGSLVLLGPVAEASLVNLYRGAAMLVYPSRYEGFGLPVLEAMQCGIPVVSANCASMPEIAGEAGVLIDPLDAEAWAREISALLRDEARRRELGRAGRARAATFSWERTAARTLEVFRESARVARAAGAP
jgi:alpha-1,3-rhamnosyl/mannosyltransferase